MQLLCLHSTDGKADKRNLTNVPLMIFRMRFYGRWLKRSTFVIMGFLVQWQVKAQIAQTRNSSLSTYGELLQDHTEFIGLHAMDATDANSLTIRIKDVLVQMNLPLSNCRGWCYE